jgi:ABC-type siderophore export system fused ATPase/permease subunit
MGKTIIMVTHENDIAGWARRIVRMRDGNIESDEANEPWPLPEGAPELPIHLLEGAA